ncbi:dienelactone hydrolase family protein [Cohnella fermenti]|uniref:Dienelactone hydrolase n=1 Tax=Cohnella fermenti TaxID=2565925 RepID=A0A4S4BS30_9BACL|nr:dienelactone hydrolase family protein [Cohnella fermenti]THF77813.1 dienelactone hydrolase [Cohnella fermenti]
MWMPDNYFERIYKETIANHQAAADRESAEQRKERLRAALKSALGQFASPLPSSEPELLSSEDCGSYIRERVKLSGVDGLSFGAYLLIPKKRIGKIPGVLAVHGHGYGSREIVGLLPDGAIDHEPPGLHRHFALELVERGLVVIAPDVIGFGERMLEEDRHKDPRHNSSCYKMATQLLLYGQTLTGLRTAELLAALEYLSKREEVDNARIGAMGFSGGALLSFVCAALDQRIQAAVLTGFPGTFKGTIMEVFHCVDNYTPGMLVHAELPEWISLIAPRSLFVESGDRDPIFPIASAESAIEELRQRYRRENAEERFAFDVFPGEHEISGRVAYDWLAGQLGT